MYHAENCWWGMPMMWFIWLPVIIIVVVLVTRYLSSSQAREKGDSPMDILKKRYARGGDNQRRI